jgi:hypothetical protein
MRTAPAVELSPEQRTALERRYALRTLATTAPKKLCN